GEPAAILPYEGAWRSGNARGPEVLAGGHRVRPYESMGTTIPGGEGCRLDRFASGPSAEPAGREEAAGPCSARDDGIFWFGVGGHGGRPYGCERWAIGQA